MKTRGRLNREIWPKPGPLLPTQNVEAQSYKSKLEAEEKSHIKQCEHHFGTIPSFLWIRAWSPHSVQNRSHLHALRARCSAKLICGYRCGRPFLRTDLRDEQWYCDDHDKLLPKRPSRLLELPGEIRDKIYKHTFPPFLGFFPQRDSERSSIKLLEVNKQIHEEVTSLMYGEKPLRLSYGQDGLNLDTHLYDWEGEPIRRTYQPERKHRASVR